MAWCSVRYSRLQFEEGDVGTVGSTHQLLHKPGLFGRLSALLLVDPKDDPVGTGMAGAAKHRALIKIHTLPIGCYHMIGLFWMPYLNCPSDLSRQCAAVTTHWGSIRVPPQKWIPCLSEEGTDKQCESDGENTNSWDVFKSNSKSIVKSLPL